MHLSEGTLLQGGKYKIIRFLSSGGFGCTYEGEHVMLHKRMAIKEFFVKDFCNRDENTSHVTVGTQSKVTLVEKLRSKFIDEAVALSQLSHPNIVSVSDVFMENGTAYYVMDFIDGKSLHQIVNERGALPENEVISYIKDVSEALKYVHSLNRLHLDIKPGNIMITNDGHAKLIDFGASKQYDEVDGENTSTLLGKTPGYAPIEQMSNTVRTFTPATDIYALGATMYKCLTGNTPPDATLLMEEGIEDFPQSISSTTKIAIEKAMEVMKKKRPQTIDEFLLLLGSTTCHPATEPTGTPPPIPSAEEIADEKTTVVNIKSGGKAEPFKRVFNVNGVTFNMIKVEGGTFNMRETKMVSSVFLGLGQNEVEVVQKTTLSDYWIAETQVTQRLWEAVMGNNPSKFVGNNLPQENVSWNDCQEFINKLNSLTGHYFRLPTEAEWEFAARGGNNSKYYQYSGSNNINDVAWYERNSGKQTHAVATKKPNELGIYDMSGNVWEWCWDWHGNYSSNSQTNPTGPSNGTKRVNRGGGWDDVDQGCSLSCRDSDEPTSRCNGIGFRLELSE